jgi:hypothetical protein
MLSSRRFYGDTSSRNIGGVIGFRVLPQARVLLDAEQRIVIWSAITSEEPFDQIAGSIQIWAEVDRLVAIASRWNIGERALPRTRALIQSAS